MLRPLDFRDESRLNASDFGGLAWSVLPLLVSRRVAALGVSGSLVFGKSPRREGGRESSDGGAAAPSEDVLSPVLDDFADSAGGSSGLVSGVFDSGGRRCFMRVDMRRAKPVLRQISLTLLHPCTKLSFTHLATESFREAGFDTASEPLSVSRVAGRALAFSCPELVSMTAAPWLLDRATSAARMTGTELPP
jgi:hypothetical protein